MNKITSRRPGITAAIKHVLVLNILKQLYSIPNAVKS